MLGWFIDLNYPVFPVFYLCIGISGAILWGWHGVRTTTISTQDITTMITCPIRELILLFKVDRQANNNKYFMDKIIIKLSVLPKFSKVKDIFSNS